MNLLHNVRDLQLTVSRTTQSLKSRWQIEDFLSDHMLIPRKGPPKQGHIVANTLLFMMFLRHANARYTKWMLCFHATQTGKHLLWKQNVSEQNQKHFFVSAVNVVRAGKRGNICVGNNVSATMCPPLPGPFEAKYPESRNLLLTPKRYDEYPLFFYESPPWVLRTLFSSAKAILFFSFFSSYVLRCTYVLVKNVQVSVPVVSTSVFVVLIVLMQFFTSAVILHFRMLQSFRLIVQSCIYYSYFKQVKKR